MGQLYPGVDNEDLWPRLFQHHCGFGEALVEHTHHAAVLRVDFLRRGLLVDRPDHGRHPGLGATGGPCCAEETDVSRLDLRPINDDPIAFDLRLLTSDYTDYDTLAATPCLGSGSTPLEALGEQVSMICDPDTQVPPDPEPRIQVRKKLRGSRSEVVEEGFISGETLRITITRLP